MKNINVILGLIVLLVVVFTLRTLLIQYLNRDSPRNKALRYSKIIKTDKNSLICFLDKNDFQYTFDSFGGLLITNVVNKQKIEFEILKTNIEKDMDSILIKSLTNEYKKVNFNKKAEILKYLFLYRYQYKFDPKSSIFTISSNFVNRIEQYDKLKMKIENDMNIIQLNQVYRNANTIADMASPPIKQVTQYSSRLSKFKELDLKSKISRAEIDSVLAVLEGKEYVFEVKELLKEVNSKITTKDIDYSSQFFIECKRKLDKALVNRNVKASLKKSVEKLNRAIKPYIDDEGIYKSYLEISSLPSTFNEDKATKGLLLIGLLGKAKTKELKKAISDTLEPILLDAAEDIVEQAFNSSNPGATINWLTKSKGVTNGRNKRIYVSFQYSVVNAFGARAQRYFKCYLSYDLSKIVDQQDEFLYFRK